MDLRKAEVNDADLVGHVHSKAWKQTYKDVFPKDYLNNDSKESRAQEFINSLDNKAITYYIMFDNCVAVGIVKVIDNLDIVEISSIYILETYRHKGYGKQAIDMIKSRRKNVKIQLWVLEFNTNARKFYESNEFKNTQKTRVINRGCEYVQIMYEYDVLD